MSEQQNQRIVQQVYESFQTGNIAAVLDALAEDVEWRTPHVEGAPYTAECNGRQEVAQFFASLDEAEEVQQFEPTEYIAQGDKVVALGKYAGKVKATGRGFQVEWVHIHTLQDGKIVKFKEIYDTAGAASAYQKGISA